MNRIASFDVCSTECSCCAANGRAGSDKTCDPPSRGNRATGSGRAAAIDGVFVFAVQAAVGRKRSARAKETEATSPAYQVSATCHVLGCDRGSTGADEAGMKQYEAITVAKAKRSRIRVLVFILSGVVECSVAESLCAPPYII